MKKILSLALILIIALILNACFVYPTQKPIKNVSKPSSSSNDTATLDDSSAPNRSFSAEMLPENNPITIPESILFEQNGVRVTAKEYITDPIWGNGIKLLIENDSEKNIGVSCNYLVVNNYMMPCFFSTTVASGKKANEVLYLSSDDMKKAGITDVGEINIEFYVFNSETYMTEFVVDEISIKTSAFDSMIVQAADDGKEVYNSNGIRIVAKYVEEYTLWGAGVVLYIENTSAENIIVQCDNLSVNGFMITPFFSCTVNAGRMALSEITLMQSELEENDISNVEEIELVFNLVDAKSYMTLYTSDVISITVGQNQ